MHAPHLRVSTFRSVTTRIRQSLKARSLLPSSDRLLLAISGGQDSLTLSEALRHIRDTTNPSPWPSFALAHCDHRWPHDAGICAHVQEYADDVGLKLHVVDAGDASPGASENAAREWRYEMLGRLAREKGYDAVVTGHTRTDLAETVLFNLGNGAGCEGLSSMGWERLLCDGVRLVRPMLDISREETGRFCEQVGVGVWRDVYNEDVRYARNRVRMEVMPVLREALHGRVEEGLARSAELLREDGDYLEQVADGLFEEVVKWREDGEGVWIDREKLVGVPVALRRRVVRRVLKECFGLEHKGKLFPQVEAVCRLVEDGVGKKAPSLVRGRQARIVCERWIEIYEPLRAES